MIELQNVGCLFDGIAGLQAQKSIPAMKLFKNFYMKEVLYYGKS